jgi:hypothetical protein
MAWQHMLLSWCLSVMTLAILYPTAKKNSSTVRSYVTALHLLFVLCKELLMDWFNPKHVTKPYERKYVMFWLLIYPSFLFVGFSGFHSWNLSYFRLLDHRQHVSAETSVSTFNIIRCKDSVDENLSRLPVFSCQYLWPSSAPIKESVNIKGCMQLCLCFQVAEGNLERQKVAALREYFVYIASIYGGSKAAYSGVLYRHTV